MPASGPDRPQSHRFPKSIRIRNRRDYLRVQQKGARAPAKHLLVLFRKGREHHPRFGLTVSKKVGNAVTRNRVKRLLREAIRHHHRLLDQSVDVVFIASPRSASASSTDLKNDVVGALRFIAARES